ncbi:MAG: glycosyltransferase [Planctomycetes bacterium]|nr:glycosyltransferase [Planctomycetota bacterium]
MKVLMLGWEYPPHIAGGLGTACEGLSRALSEEGVELLFVVPRMFGDEPASHMQLIGAADVNISAPVATVVGAPPRTAALEARAGRSRVVESQHESVLTLALDCLLQPYDRPAQYVERRSVLTRRQSEIFEPGVVAPPQEQPLLRTEQSSRVPEAGRTSHYASDMFGEVSRYAGAVSAIAATHEFDVIHAHDWMTYPAAYAAARASGKPVVLHVHSLEYDRSGEHVNHGINNIEREGLRAASRIVAVSYYTKSLVSRMHGIDESRISVVHNGVSRNEGLAQYHLEEDKTHRHVLFMGRITFQKGPEFFVRAAQKVVGHVKDVRFVMAGSGDMLDSVKALVRGLGLDAWFEFPGFLRGNERERYFTLADVYMMPSVSEPFGITPLEAMAFDVPVVISRQSGVSEVLRHAFKVDFWDVDRMAELLIALLNHQPLSREMTRMAQRELLHLHWRAAAEKMVEVYRKVAPAA